VTQTTQPGASNRDEGIVESDACKSINGIELDAGEIVFHRLSVKPSRFNLPLQ